MQQLTNIGNAILTMTSREIADLTGKEHKHVLTDIRKLLEELDIDGPEFRRIYMDSMNRQQTEFVLDRELTDTLLTGYSAIARRNVIARWHKLESEKAAPAVPQTLSAALRLAADQADLIEAQKTQLAIAAPKAAFVDAYVDSSGLKGFRQVAKLLKANEARLREFLSEKKIMYLLGGEWMAYQQHIDAGRFAVKAGTSQINGRAFNRSFFTTKGIEWLAGLWVVHCLDSEVAA